MINDSKNTLIITEREFRSDLKHLIVSQGGEIVNTLFEALNKYRGYYIRRMIETEKTKSFKSDFELNIPDSSRSKELVFNNSNVISIEIDKNDSDLILNELFLAKAYFNYVRDCYAYSSLIEEVSIRN